MELSGRKCAGKDICARSKYHILKAGVTPVSGKRVGGIFFTLITARGQDRSKEFAVDDTESLVSRSESQFICCWSPASFAFEINGVRNTASKRD
jgi:hypothetical protein